MCGIVGIFSPSLSHSQRDATVTEMLARQSHRGPDATGMWSSGPVTLGHNRLSIIDLSADANQPFYYHGMWITYNGEVYNYIELRQELCEMGYEFTTQSDTEVIVACYHFWGTKCVEKFIGMWAFVLWDTVRDRLFCSRDRFGIKPFHYIQSGSHFAFASEIKALKATQWFSNDINTDQVARGLHLGWMHYADETYFSCVRALPAAHNLIIENGTTTIERYWDVDYSKQFQGSVAEKTAHYRALFMDSIKLHQRRDVTLGVCLSGGLDSSSIVAALSVYSNGAPLETFSAYYEGADSVDERPFINLVTDKYPNIVPHFISPSEDDVVKHIDNIMYHMDVPMPGSSYVSHYFVMKLAGEHGIKVVLDGQGSDETMAGYMHSFYRLIADYIAAGNPARGLGAIFTHAKRQQFGMAKSLGILGKSILTLLRPEQKLYATEFKHYYPRILKRSYSQPPFQLAAKGRTRLQRFLYNLTYTTLLPTLLHTEDINAMAFSIESRVPFLDHRLVEFSASLRNDDLIQFAETKFILRNALRDILPPEIADRKDKKGFVTPGEVRWLRGKLSHLIEGDFSELQDLVDVRRLKGLVADFIGGSNKNAILLWRLAMLRAWVRKV